MYKGTRRKESEPRRQRDSWEKDSREYRLTAVTSSVDRNNLRCDVVIELCYRILKVTSVTTKNILSAIQSACLGRFLSNIYLNRVCGKVHSISDTCIFNSSNFTHDQQRWFDV